MPENPPLWKYCADHPRIAGVFALIALSATFAAKESVVAIWICIAIACMLSATFVFGEAWFTGTPRAREKKSLISVFVAMALCLYGYWLTDRAPKNPNEEVLIKLQQLQDRIGSGQSEEEPRPGFSIHLLMKLPEQPVLGDCYIVEYGGHDKDDFSLYVDTESKELVLAVRDSMSVLYRVEAPIGIAGVPIDQPMYVAVSYGIATSATYMSIFVDGKEMGRLAIPKQIQARNFATFPGSIGAGLGHKSCAMTAYEMAIYDRTLAPPEIRQVLARFSQTLQQRGVPINTPQTNGGIVKNP